MCQQGAVAGALRGTVWPQIKTMACLQIRQVGDDAGGSGGGHGARKRTQQQERWQTRAETQMTLHLTAEAGGGERHAQPPAAACSVGVSRAAAATTGTPPPLPSNPFPLVQQHSGRMAGGTTAQQQKRTEHKQRCSAYDTWVLSEARQSKHLQQTLGSGPEQRTGAPARHACTNTA